MKRSKKISKSTPKEQATDTVPDIQQGLFGVQLTAEELDALSGLLGICEKTFEALAADHANQGQTPIAEILMARSKLSGLFSRKFSTIKRIGEPDSRNLH